MAAKYTKNRCAESIGIPRLIIAGPQRTAVKIYTTGRGIPIPNTSAETMVKHRARNRLFPAIKTTILVNFPPRPVNTIEPTTIPAQAQEVTTDKDVLTVLSRVSNNRNKLILVVFLKKLDIKINIEAVTAQSAGAYPFINKMISVNIGTMY
ncbi:hypothetical protein JCM12296A_51050 [Desulfosarcina cetonica]